MLYLLELRKRLLIVGVFFLALFILVFYFSSPIFQWLVAPLQNILPAEDAMIATGVTSPILTPLALALSVAIFCTIPFALFHLWQFVAPGLYRNERRGLGWVFIASFTLFLSGVLFCYFGVLPFMFHLFSSLRPPNVRFLPDITSTVQFTIHMLTLFGLCFQLPLICVVLVRMGVLSRDALVKLRPYVIVGAFIVGMLLTPPDVLSQIMLAVPLCLLYEGGLLFLYCSSA